MNYFALSDEHFSRIGKNAMRVLQPDVVDPLPYAEKMENLNAIFCGYLETGNTNLQQRPLPTSCSGIRR